MILPLSNIDRLKKLIRFSGEIELIKPREETVLRMYYVEGFTLQKIADQLELNKQNIYYIRRTALSKLNYGSGFRSRVFAAYKDMLERVATGIIVHTNQESDVVFKIENKGIR
jgi:predicted DNA-binding protein YlxM (UPF0122 family)